MREVVDISFLSKEDFRKWLEENSLKSKGVWIRFMKKNPNAISAEQALSEALCFGWIDGQMKSIDDTKYMKYFAPRRPDSPWSEKNKKTVESLRASGRMTTHGERVISVSLENGKWDAITEKFDFDNLIEEFKILLEEQSDLKDIFLSQSKSYMKQLVGFYFSAKKQETRQKRFEKIMDALRTGKKGMLF